MKALFTLSGVEGLDAALLRSPLGTPDGGNDSNKRIYYIQFKMTKGLQVDAHSPLADINESNYI